MKTTFIFDGKKITKKTATEIVGAERLERLIKEAHDGFMCDPYEEQSWFICGGVLVISFC